VSGLFMRCIFGQLLDWTIFRYDYPICLFVLFAQVFGMPIASCESGSEE
jgi:hypothetical protein